ncbi:MAG: RraA family protein [Anaerolineae bacterium]
MDNQSLGKSFSDLSTPLVADACLRAGVPIRFAPPGIQPVVTGSKVAGRALPVRHYGSVDIFLEAMGSADEGDVLVIDNGGRRDEACVGDLTALEARASGLVGMVVWGFHRDTADLIQIGFPVFSYGAFPPGPQRLDEREPEALETAHFGEFMVGRADVVFADADGVLFVPLDQSGEVIAGAETIRQAERRQAEAVEAGTTLHDQLQFEEYLARRDADPSYTFREHLRRIGGAIEE